MDSIKAGVIGVGRMGLYHANILSSMSPQVELTGVSDTSEETARKASSKYNVPYYTNNDELLDKVDAVCIAVPTYLHYKETMRAFNHNVHVLVEKPITNNLEQAEELVENSIRKGLVFQVGHIERFRGTVTEIKKLISKPYLIEAKRLQPRSDRINDVGVVLDLMIHDIDIINLLSGSEVMEISAFANSIYTNFEDIAKVIIMFENGTIADLTASRLAQNKVRCMNLFQEENDIYLDYLKDEISIHGKRTENHEAGNKELKYHEKMFTENLYIKTENPLKNEITHFINCITGKEKQIVNGERDIKTLKIALKILNIIYDSDGKPKNQNLDYPPIF